jgi:hypothetical protein
MPHWLPEWLPLLGPADCSTVSAFISRIIAARRTMRAPQVALCPRERVAPRFRRCFHWASGLRVSPLAGIRAAKLGILLDTPGYWRPWATRPRTNLDPASIDASVQRTRSAPDCSPIKNRIGTVCRPTSELVRHGRSASRAFSVNLAPEQFRA